MALTKSDKKFIEGVVSVKTITNLTKIVLEELIVEKELVTKADLKYLPTKDEFYEETLKILKGIEDLKDEKDVLTKQVSDHSDKIEKLENIHPNKAHLATI